jgi:hypothetical protein
VDLVEKNNAHYYRINEKDTLLPGYSTIFRKVVAKPALVNWAAKLAGEAAAEAAHAEVKAALAAGKWSRPLVEAREAWKKIGAGAPNAKRDAAADTGTGLHTDLEFIVKGEPMPDRPRTDEDKKALDNFLGYWSTSGLRYVASEICVAVPPADMVLPPEGAAACWATATGANPWPCAPYGGRLDLLLADRADNLILADFKTGSAVDRKKGVPYPDVWMQEAAYKVALECTYPGVKVAKMVMLHVRHDVPSDKVFYACHDMERAGQAWTRIRGLYDDLRVLEEAA